MVDVKPQLARPRQAEVQATNPRGARQKRRMKILKQARPDNTSVRVVPDEKYRDVLKHPNGTRFRATGSVAWPNDRFTQRRLRDGSVTLEKKPATTSEETRTARNQPTPSD